MGANDSEFDRKSAPEFRPPAELLETARKTATLYRMTLEEKDGWWTGSSVEIPGTFSSAKTLAECVKKTQFALTLAVAYLMHTKEAVPRPCRDVLRDKQVNVRLTAEEKLYLDTTARSEGFRSASDLIRTAVFSFLGRGRNGLSKA
jgi:predicted RNase H-like HicB family nuclease